MGMNPLKIPVIQHMILDKLSGRDILTCRSLNLDWKENCDSHLCRNNKLVVRITRENIQNFIASLNDDGLAEFIRDGQAVAFNMNLVDMNRQEYQTLFSIIKNPRIYSMVIIMKPSSLEKNISLLHSSCLYYENLSIIVHMPGDHPITDTLNISVGKTFQQNQLRRSFPKLTAIYIRGDRLLDEFSDFIANIIFAAPKLNSLQVKLTTKLALSLANNPILSLKKLRIRLYRDREPNNLLTGEALRLFLQRVAPNLEWLLFVSCTPEHVSTFYSCRFANVTSLIVASSYHASIDFRCVNRFNFPGLRKFVCGIVGGSTTTDGQTANDIVPSPHPGVEIIGIGVWCTSQLVSLAVLKNLQEQFPSATKYYISDKNSDHIFPMLCFLKNRSIQEINLELDGNNAFPQEYFTGIYADKLHLIKSGSEEDNIRELPCVADIPNLEVLVITTEEDTYIPDEVVWHGLARIKQLKKLMLPTISGLSLRFIADRFERLEFLALKSCPEESDRLYLQHKRPQLVFHSSGRQEKPVEARPTREIVNDAKLPEAQY